MNSFSNKRSSSFASKPSVRIIKISVRSWWHQNKSVFSSNKRSASLKSSYSFFSRNTKITPSSKSCGTGTSIMQNSNSENSNTKWCSKTRSSVSWSSSKKSRANCCKIRIKRPSTLSASCKMIMPMSSWQRVSNSNSF